MGRKANSTGDEAKQGGSRRGLAKGNKLHYLNVTLSTSDKERLRSKDMESFPSLDYFDDIVSSGFRFSLSPSRDDSGFMAMLVDTDAHSDTYNYALSAFGSSPVNATRALFYKHVYILDGDWVPVESTGESDDYR